MARADALPHETCQRRQDVPVPLHVGRRLAAVEVLQQAEHPGLILGRHPAILDEAAWAAACKAIDARSTGKDRRSSKRRTYLLSGIIECACGANSTVRRGTRAARNGATASAAAAGRPAHPGTGRGRSFTRYGSRAQVVGADP